MTVTHSDSVSVRLTAGIMLTSLLCAGQAFGKKQQGQRVPDELESLGGHALGLANGGSAAVADLSAVRNNPALIAFEKQYSLSAGYHWPSVGREFYQAGAVDSRTSQVAAGVSYTSGKEKYRPESGMVDTDDRYQAYYDSPIKFRAAGALAQPFQNIALGIGAGYVEGFVPEDREQAESPLELVKGATLGMGLAGLLTPELRFGVSVENLANRKVRDIAPRTVRGGIAWTLLAGRVTLHGDYRQRERIYQERTPARTDELSLGSEGEAIDKPEQMITGSFSVRIQDVFRVFGAFGEDISGTTRRTLGGGVAIVNKNFSLSYMIGKPYLSDSTTHQAVNLSMQVTI